MNKIYYVYGYFCPDTSVPLYIGKGKNQRMFDHLHHAKYHLSNNTRFIRKLKRMLIENKEPIILKLVENLEEQTALDFEESLILKYGRKHFDLNGLLYNVCTKNNNWSTLKHSNKTKEKISVANKGRIVSEDVKKRISNSLKGKVMPARSEQWSIKQRASHLGRKDPITAFDNKSKAQSGANNPRSKTWKLQIEDRSIIVIESLKTWCKENSINLYKLRKTLDNNTSYNNMKLIN